MAGSALFAPLLAGHIMLAWTFQVSLPIRIPPSSRAVTTKKNDLQWPSVSHLPRQICYRLTQALEDEVQDFSQFRKFVFDSPVSCSEKLDGTNVGKTRDGTLLGRKLTIDDAANQYQKCPLEPLRALQTKGCIDDVLALLGQHGTKKVGKSALYGELCCNSGLYTYKDRGLPKTWQLFGAVVELQDMATAEQAACKAQSQGLLCTTSKGAPIVQIGSSPMLSNLFSKHGLPHIKTEEFANVYELIAQKKGWMMSERGEGLVLSVGMEEDSAVYKWKISREPQEVTIAELEALITRFKQGSGADADPKILSLLDSLHAVATHPDSETIARAEKKKDNLVKTRAVDASKVQVALESALTKFDSLDVTFSERGQSAMADLVKQLMQELMSDTDLELPAGEEKRAAAVREVEGDVKRFVGQAFGQFSRRNESKE